MSNQEWILFNSQLPASPSSPRVTVWRRMKGAGSISLQNGVWILPHTAVHEQFLQDVLDYVIGQGGTAQLFKGTSLNATMETEIIARFKAERQEEYDELLGHCRGFLAELEREIGKQKFTYNELEESEANFERLTKWFHKIQQRDFFGDGTAVAAEIERCRQTLATFTQLIYAQEGIEPLEPDDPS